MALIKLEDYNPNYQQEIFEGRELKGYEVYSDRSEKIGTLENALLDESGRFRYFVVDVKGWFNDKEVLVPTGRTRLDYDQNQVYIRDMTKEQVKNLPEYRDDMTVDYDYEEQVRNVYRQGQTETGATNRETYSYEQEPSLYEVNEKDHQNLKLYEERLVTSKDRYKTGEVAVNKRVESDTAEASVPYEKERVVVERGQPERMQPAEPGATDFRDKEVARMDVHEESADIQKQAFVREEVNVKKEAERESVDAKETVRREELDVKTEGEPKVRGNQ
jgi:uncharacterized protein (TIGR02271 family)